VVFRALDAGIIREERGFVSYYVAPDGIVGSADPATKHSAPLGREDRLHRDLQTFPPAGAGNQLPCERTGVPWLSQMELPWPVGDWVTRNVEPQR
jgi:hypothetical protein